MKIYFMGGGVDSTYSFACPDGHTLKFLGSGEYDNIPGNIGNKLIANRPDLFGEKEIDILKVRGTAFKVKVKTTPVVIKEIKKGAVEHPLTKSMKKATEKVKNAPKGEKKEVKHGNNI